VRVEARLVQADEADELTARDDLDSPDPPSALGDPLAAGGGERVACARA